MELSIKNEVIYVVTISNQSHTALDNITDIEELLY
jgi:hypothetical protein